MNGEVRREHPDQTGCRLEQRAADDCGTAGGLAQKYVNRVTAAAVSGRYSMRSTKTR